MFSSFMEPFNFNRFLINGFIFTSRPVDVV